VYDDVNPTAETVAPANTNFDNALALFKAGDYQNAMPLFDAAVRDQPGEAIIHEVRALNLFALGEYAAAAAVLNSLLSAAPGMDWTTMSGLYGDVADYTTQLRALEAHCKADPKDAGAYFVLAYHYLVTGYQDDAVNTLRVVVANQPNDVTAQRMLEALTEPEPTEPAPAQSSPATSNGPLMAPPAATTPAEPGPQIDLAGAWRAKAGGDTTIDLVITENSTFTWTANQPGQPPIVVSGDMAHTSDALEFDSKEQGAMVGSVSTVSADQWRFRLDGSPPSDPGLTFERVK